MCFYVLAYLPNSESQRHQILLAHAESIDLDSEGVVVFHNSLGTTRFFVDQTCLHSHANFSKTAHQISTELKLLIPALGQYAQSVWYSTSDIDKRKIFLVFGSKLASKFQTVSKPSSEVYGRRACMQSITNWQCRTRLCQKLHMSLQNS